MSCDIKLLHSEVLLDLCSVRCAFVIVIKRMLKYHFDFLKLSQRTERTLVHVLYICSYIHVLAQPFTMHS